MTDITASQVFARMAVKAWNWIYGVLLVVGFAALLVSLLIKWPWITMGLLVGFVALTSAVLWYDETKIQLTLEKERRERLDALAERLSKGK